MFFISSKALLQLIIDEPLTPHIIGCHFYLWLELLVFNNSDFHIHPYFRNNVKYFTKMTSKSEKDRAKQIQDRCQNILMQMLKDEDNKYCVDCDAKGELIFLFNLFLFSD